MIIWHTKEKMPVDINTMYESHIIQLPRTYKEALNKNSSQTKTVFNVM
jgi:hypothetical protein